MDCADAYMCSIPVKARRIPLEYFYSHIRIYSQILTKSYLFVMGFTWECYCVRVVIFVASMIHEEQSVKAVAIFANLSD